MPVTLTPGRPRQEDHVVEASLGYTGSMMEGRRRQRSWGWRGRGLIAKQAVATALVALGIILQWTEVGKKGWDPAHT